MDQVDVVSVMRAGKTLADAPAPQPAPVLSVRGLRKEYRLPGQPPIRVLEDVSLDVLPGERIAITGRSGAGKTTLLNLLGGLDRPTAGSIVCTPRTGFVFQGFHLLPELTVVENVLLPAMAAGRIRATDRARASELLAKVGLTHRAAHLPAELSGGEQQRVALARALVTEPDLIFADEPTGNLDALTGAEILDMLLGLGGRSFALVMVTHSETAAAGCDRRLVLENGHLDGLQPVGFARHEQK